MVREGNGAQCQREKERNGKSEREREERKRDRERVRGFGKTGEGQQLSSKWRSRNRKTASHQLSQPELQTEKEAISVTKHTQSVITCLH